MLSYYYFENFCANCASTMSSWMIQPSTIQKQLHLLSLQIGGYLADWACVKSPASNCFINQTFQIILPNSNNHLARTQQGIHSIWDLCSCSRFIETFLKFYSENSRNSISIGRVLSVPISYLLSSLSRKYFLGPICECFVNGKFCYVLCGT